MYSERVSAYIKGLTAYLVQAGLKNKVVFPKDQSNLALLAQIDNKQLYHPLCGARVLGFWFKKHNVKQTKYIFFLTNNILLTFYYADTQTHNMMLINDCDNPEPSILQFHSHCNQCWASYIQLYSSVIISDICNCWW